MNSIFLILVISGYVLADGGVVAPAANYAAVVPASGLYGSPSDVLVQYGDNDAAASDLNGVLADAGNGIEDLKNNIPGVPGEDYPILAEVPELSFTCDGRVAGGYYADIEAKCQVFHICTTDDKGELTTISFLCPNGTIFNQNYFICDWWFNFECSEAEALYSLNDKIAAERDELAAAASDALSTYSAGPVVPLIPVAPVAPVVPVVPVAPVVPIAPVVPLATYEETRAGRSRKIAKPFVPRFNSLN